MAPSRTPAVALLLTAGALLLSACSASTPAGGSAANDREAVRAITAAESSAGGRAFQLESDDGVWEVHVASGDREVEVRVSADGGEVTATSDSGALDGADRAALDAAVTTLADAVRIAAAQGEGGAIDEAELRREGSTTTWDVELIGGAVVRVSAADGSIG
ncbi:PepSY domain-containing protein [Microbacterium testaceum]|uniref:PepSY domain-containing protein n=1 Tax=Microbacterium testaceum TaxID=2033 RepID=UPI0012447A2E|nr:PepSY domain-containing protein [Microbacterium testaceum]